MNINTVEDCTRRIVADVLGLPLDQITLETSYSTVPGWDSLVIINMVMAIGEEFQVEISIEDASRFQSVSEIVNVLRERGVQ